MINSIIGSMKKQECDYILLQGVFLISVLFFALFVSSILFIFHISITQANLVLAILCSVAVTFYFSGGSIKKTAITTIVGLLIIAVCVFLCMHVYDWSWDGNAYRKSRTGLLKYGWNPIYEIYFDFAISNNMSFLKSAGIWFDTFPKASEIIAANFYAVTNNIEAGKCYTIVSVFALFFISYAFLAKTGALKKWQSFCCALFCVLNPIAIAQCLTNYNDAFLAALILLCLVSLLYLTFYEKEKYNLLSWYFIFISINIGFNIKLSMPLFLAILCITFFCYWLFLKIKILGLCKTLLYYRKHFCFFVIAVLFGFLVSGSTYYVSNFLHYGHPFGGSTTGGIGDEITNQLPIAYKDMSNIERFFCSLFSKTNGSKAIESVEWKVPFTFDSSEIIAAQGYDTRTSGWGILFSGIFLISVVILIYYFFVNKKKIIMRLKDLAFLLIITFFISLCFVPGLSWARYNLFVFLLPVTALLCVFIDMNSEKINGTVMSVFAGVLIALLSINMVPNIMKDGQLLKSYASTYDQLEQFRFVTEYNDVIVEQESGFYGRFFTLYDMGITNWTYGDVDPEYCTGSLFNQWKLYYDIKFCISDTNNLDDFLGYVSKAQNYIMLLSVKDEASNALTEEMIQTMQSLGLEFDLANHYRWSYLAVIDSGNVVYEDMSDVKLEYGTEIAGNKIDMQSAGYETGNIASIKINGLEYALNKRGINIVVYDKQANRVIDSVRIDTYIGDELTR